MTTTPPSGPTLTQREFGIDPLICAATLMAPAASKEDSCPQAILKSYPCSSLDYRAHQRLPIIKETCLFSGISLHSLKRSI